MISAAVITVSSTKAAGEGSDQSGPQLAGALERIGAEVLVIEIVPDDREMIAGRLRHWVEQEVDLVATAGGIGFAPEDVTPEATFEVIERYAPGLAEAMRAAVGASQPEGWLSRAVAGIAAGTLIVNFPDDAPGLEACFGALESVLPPAIAMIGQRPRQ